MSSTSGKRTSDDQDPNSDDQNGDLLSFMSKNAEEQTKLGYVSRSFQVRKSKVIQPHPTPTKTSPCEAQIDGFQSAQHIIAFLETLPYQKKWEFQVPKTEVLYHIELYKALK